VHIRGRSGGGGIERGIRAERNLCRIRVLGPVPRPAAVEIKYRDDKHRYGTQY
jgi:hypothetical protein